MIPDVIRAFERVPLALVDDPEITMRETFDDDAFAELVESIRVNGLQVPPIVERRGERYRVSAGHRRVTALRHLAAEFVLVDVREPGDMDAEAIKILENDDREKVNPAESALYLMRLFVERCQNDVDTLCTLTRRSRKYVDDRLRLLHGDDEIFSAVRARKIGLTVGKELNAITDVNFRRLALDDALKFGMTSAAAIDRRRTYNRMVEMGTRPGDGAVGAADSNPTPAMSEQLCHVCRKGDHPERLRWIIVHEHCELTFLEPAIAGARAVLAEMVRG
jgi:ParB family chromosome partitioning protein